MKKHRLDGRAIESAMRYFTAIFLLTWIGSATFDVSADEFSDDFSSGIASPDRWQFDAKGPCKIDVIDSPDRESGGAVRFRSGPNARCELVPRVFNGPIGDYLREPFNQDRWYSFKVYLAEPWEITDENEVIAQWHSTGDRFFFETSGRGPPLAIRIIGKHFRISYGWDKKIRSTERSLARYTLWYGPLAAGRWVHWIVHARWAYDEEGLIRIWKDGELIVDKTGPNTFNDLRGVYLKLGSYHPSTDREVVMDDIYIGGRDPRLEGLGATANELD